MCRSLTACLVLILNFAANPAWAQMRWHDTLVTFATCRRRDFQKASPPIPPPEDIYVAYFRHHRAEP
jgi:hypothetical protein